MSSVPLCRECNEPVDDDIDDLVQHWVSEHPQHDDAYDVFDGCCMWAICPQCCHVFAAEVRWSSRGPVHDSYCQRCRGEGVNRFFVREVDASEVIEYETPFSEHCRQLNREVDALERRVTRLEIIAAVVSAQSVASKAAVALIRQQGDSSA